MKTMEITGKIQKNYNVTIPKKVREIFRLEKGDFVEFVISKEGILLAPKKLVDSSQAYFWSSKWQKDEAEAEKDIKAGRVSKTKDAKELIEELEK